MHKVRQLEDRLKVGTAWRGNEWGLVFTSEVGTGLEPRNANRQITALLKSAGLDPIRLHNCRHTACAFLLAQSIPIYVGSQILGHASPNIL